MNKIIAYRDPLAPDVDVAIRDQWVSQASYLETAMKMVIPCTDAVVLLKGDHKALWLGKRTILPMRGIWCIGGRIFFNDRTLEESVARCVELETGLRLLPERFSYVCANFYSWIKVAQGDFPGKNIAAVYKCEVTEAELNQMSHGLSQTEYDRGFGLQRFDRARLVDESVHQAMVDIYDRIFPKVA